MLTVGAQEMGWMLTGPQAIATLWVWLAVVLAQGLLWRSLRRPEPDRIRPSGPAVDPSA